MMETISKYTSLQVYANIDPTRTTVLRNAFAKDMARRFAELISIIYKTIVEKDCFGLAIPKLEVNQMQASGLNEFNFTRSSDKAAAFMAWLQKQIDAGILEVKDIQQIGSSVNAVWTNKYIYDSYKRGVIRARYELQKEGFRNIPSIESTGGIITSMATPFHLDRLGLLYTRVYSDLQGVTSQMDTQISRVLTQGIADGDNPNLLARKLRATINGAGIGDLGMTDTLGRYIPATRRAEMIARTEIIRAHHVATIQEYRNWAVEGVSVRGEWKTAQGTGDSKNGVCDDCQGYEGRLFDLDEIETMIPFHPNCRCIALPVMVKSDNKYERI